jgi:hypothetical protein
MIVDILYFCFFNIVLFGFFILLQVEDDKIIHHSHKNIILLSNIKYIDFKEYGFKCIHISALLI